MDFFFFTCLSKILECMLLQKWKTDISSWIFFQHTNSKDKETYRNKQSLKILCHLLLFKLANQLSYLFSIYTVFSPLPHRLQLTHMLHQTICYKYVSRSDLFLTKTCHPVSLACTHSWGPESSRCSGPRKVPQ